MYEIIRYNSTWYISVKPKMSNNTTHALSAMIYNVKFYDSLPTHSARYGKPHMSPTQPVVLASTISVRHSVPAAHEISYKQHKHRHVTSDDKQAFETEPESYHNRSPVKYYISCFTSYTGHVADSWNKTDDDFILGSRQLKIIK